MPGSQRSTLSESDSLPSPTSWSATVDTNDLVMLPARKRSVGRKTRPLLVSATPAAERRTLWPSLTSAIAPGAPAATTFRSAVASVGRVAFVALAETAVAGAAPLAAVLSEAPQ